MLSDSDINLLDSIKYSAIQYEMFKRSLIVGTEERMRKSNIDVASARSVLDDILLSLNGLKTSEDSFSTSHMIAASGNMNIVLIVIRILKSFIITQYVYQKRISTYKYRL